MTKKVVTFGEIMLRLATPEHQRFSQATSFCASFGGGEANVAVSLANFGVPADFVTRLPDNDIGCSVIMDLKKHSVGTENIIFGGDRLGIYFLETGSVSTTKSLGLPVRYNQYSEKPEWMNNAIIMSK